ASGRWRHPSASWPPTPSSSTSAWLAVSCWSPGMTCGSARMAESARGSFAPLRQPVFAVLWAATVLGNIGSFMRDVASSWLVTDLVPRADLKSAVALNSLGINIARSIGPAAGGLILASFGAAVTYGADVLSYAFVIAALIWWRRPATPDSGLSENFLGAFRAG